MWVRFSGILGLVVFLFGFVTSILMGRFQQPLLVLHMVCGLILMMFWFFAYGLKNMNQAGQALKGRTARFSANVILYSIVMLGLLGVVYYLSYINNKRWDLTENSVYSLSTQTVSALNKLTLPLKIIGFKGISQTANEDELKEQLELYKFSNPKLVKTEIIDARTKPHLLEKYQIKTGNLVYIEYGEGDKKAVSRINEGTEQAITNAIIKLTRGAAKKIYYVVGHDEPDIKSDQAPGLSSFASAISDEHLTLDTLLLSQSAQVPADTAAIILCSPKKPLLKEELEVLQKYVNEGGRLLLFTDPRTTSDVRQLASQYGIKVGEDVVIDQIQRLFAAPALGAQPVVRQYTSHAITKNLKADDVTVFNISASVEPEKNSEAGVTLTALAKTGTTAWAEKDLDGLFNEENPSATFDNSVDSPGPVSLAVSYEKKLSPEDKPQAENKEQEFEKISRIVVFGDSDWILNANIGVYSNRDFVLSALNWLVGEEGGVSIGKKNMRMSDAPMTNDNFLFLLAASFVIPEVILIFGLFVWWRRKHAYGA